MERSQREEKNCRKVRKKMANISRPRDVGVRRRCIYLYFRFVVQHLCIVQSNCCSAIVAEHCAIGLEHEGLYTFAKCFVYL